MPASRSARAMIFAPRSCPSSPGLATTTRIFWVVLGTDMGAEGAWIQSRETRGGPWGAPPAAAKRARLADLDRHLHRRRVDLAEDRVGPLRPEYLRHGAARPYPRDLLLAVDARALRDHDVV